MVSSKKKNGNKAILEGVLHKVLASLTLKVLR